MSIARDIQDILEEDFAKPMDKDWRFQTSMPADYERLEMALFDISEHIEDHIYEEVRLPS